jgi:amino acid transporter
MLLGFGEINSETFRFDDKFEPLTWILLVIILLLFKLNGEKFFWKISNILVIIALGIIMLYIVGTFATIHSKDYSNTPTTTPGTNPDNYPIAIHFFIALPYTSWMFIGLDSIPLIGKFSTQVKIYIYIYII